MEIDTSPVGLLVVAVSTLAGVIVVFWQAHKERTKRDQAEIEEYKELHREAISQLGVNDKEAAAKLEQMYEKVIGLTGKVSKMEGRQEGVEQLSRQVLNFMESNHEQNTEILQHVKGKDRHHDAD